MQYIKNSYTKTKNDEYIYKFSSPEIYIYTKKSQFINYNIFFASFLSHFPMYF